VWCAKRARWAPDIIIECPAVLFQGRDGLQPGKCRVIVNGFMAKSVNCAKSGNSADFLDCNDCDADTYVVLMRVDW
jgi:hypothetical protein